MSMSDAVGALRRQADRYAAVQDELLGATPIAEGEGPVGDSPRVDVAAWRAETVATRVARLYRELFPAVFGFVHFRVGDTYVAEDLTATVFERALTKLARVREPDRVRAWIFSI